MSWRDTKISARGVLHREMGIPASYYVSPSASPVLISVRVHNRFIQQGDLKGTNFNYAEVEEEAPKIVFLRSEVPSPVRGSLVIIAADEGYRIGHTEPPDNITIKAACVPLSATDLAGKTLPENL